MTVSLADAIEEELAKSFPYKATSNPSYERWISFDEVLDWVDYHVNIGDYVQRYHVFYFKRQEDAVKFALRWS